MVHNAAHDNVISFTDYRVNRGLRLSSTTTTGSPSGSSSTNGSLPVQNNVQVEIQNHAVDAYFRPLPPIIVSKAYYYVRELCLDVVLAAIDESAAAPYPSWRYAEAILRRCLRDGIRTIVDYQRSNDEYMQSKMMHPAITPVPIGPRINPAREYNQRNYDDAAMQDITLDLSKIPGDDA